MKNRLSVISAAVIVSCAIALHATENQDKSGKPPEQKPAAPDFYRGSASVLGGITMVGAQLECTFNPYIGIRGVALFIPGANFNSLNRDEWILSAIVTPVLHLGPELPILDPVLMLGMVYSYHHWEMKLSRLGIRSDKTIRKGNFHDVTFGAGLGFLFKFAGRFKTGVTLWINYDYSVDATFAMKKKKGDRIILPVPIIEFMAQF